ncbi:MAG: SxtJ family membrane protein, partial [Pirellulaceae bacterium]|nr:SxtJ family membrane protein [Pirellulaceae bacterium]
LLLLFVGGLGALAWWRGEALLPAAAFLSVAWLVSLIFNRENRMVQLTGALLPGLCLAIGAPMKAGAESAPIACVVWVLGGICGLTVLAAPGIGRRIYVVWMLAALPIGWTISHAVLAVAYYGVFAPMGLIMRRYGWDPMHRKFHRDAATYWISRGSAAETPRYFRQF